MPNSSPCPRCGSRSLTLALDDYQRRVPHCLLCGWEMRQAPPPIADPAVQLSLALD